MEVKRRYLGRWELGCMVFHACFYKSFTSFPKQFSALCGTAGWLNALYTGLLFLGVFGVVLFLITRCQFQIPKVLSQIWRVFLAAYWIISAGYALGEFARILQEVAFPRSPQWFLGGILLLGAVIAVLCGSRAVYRMHSLSVLGVGISMAVVAVLGLKYAQPIYLTPWLGKGAESVFGTLSTLFFYTDSILIFQLAGNCRKEVDVCKTGFLGAALAVVLNIALVLVSAMSHSAALGEISSNLIYPLTKGAYFGNFWSRMDAIYLLAVMTSGFLYLSMALHLFGLAVKGIEKNSFKGKKVVAGCLAGILCVSLTGCYDSREVEAAAYTVALGIDKGEEHAFRYTFQLSNPLELGGSMETSADSQSQGEEEDTKENKTVSNITIEADHFYLALNHLKSHLSKEPDFSHLKLLVFSIDSAKAGILEHASLLFREQEVRPSTNVCLAKSAEKFLKKVKPTLEQSTARYYELFFQNQNTPYAPVMQLRELVSRGTDGGWDPVLPVATPEKLSGIGIFRKGKLVAIMDEKAAMLYGLLSGDAEEIAILTGETSFSVSSKTKPKFSMNKNQIGVKNSLTVKVLSGNPSDSMRLQSDLEKEMTEFLAETVRRKADVLGIGAWLRSGMIREEEWKNLNWHRELSNMELFSQIRIKNLQK